MYIMYIVMYQYVKYKCKLWKAHWLYCVFFLGIFINYLRAVMSEVLYLHKKFTDCVSKWAGGRVGLYERTRAKIHSAPRPYNLLKFGLFFGPFEIRLNECRSIVVRPIEIRPIEIHPIKIFGHIRRTLFFGHIRKTLFFGHIFFG